MEEEYKLGNTTQEFEELFGNVPFEDIEKIKKWLFNNFIPKSVIQNKIDETKLKLKDVSKRREKAKAKEEENVLWCLEIRLDEKIKTLQKLLNES